MATETTEIFSNESDRSLIKALASVRLPEGWISRGYHMLSDKKPTEMDADELIDIAIIEDSRKRTKNLVRKLVQLPDDKQQAILRDLGAQVISPFRM